jgi:hypothetical protein
MLASVNINPKNINEKKNNRSLVSITPLEMESKCVETLKKLSTSPTKPVKLFDNIEKIIWKKIPINRASR